VPPKTSRAKSVNLAVCGLPLMGRTGMLIMLTARTYKLASISHLQSRSNSMTMART
jgi:hypothetical protein